MEMTEYLYGWTWVGDYNPFALGWQACSPGHSSGPGIREFRVIHYILSGKGLLRIRNKEYHLGAGDLFSLPPFETVYYEADAEDPWTYIWISFVNNETATYLFDDYVVSAPQLRSVFLELQNYDDQEHTGKVHTATCLSYIADQLRAKKSDDAILVDNAIGYIQQHFSNSMMTVAELAEYLEVSRYRLSAAFVQERGISPLQYIIQYRLERACKYMAENHTPPSVASRSVGYINYPQFYKMFRRHKGITPNEYYKKYASDQELSLIERLDAPKADG